MTRRQEKSARDDDSDEELGSRKHARSQQPAAMFESEEDSDSSPKRVRRSQTQPATSSAHVESESSDDELLEDIRHHVASTQQVTIPFISSNDDSISGHESGSLESVELTHFMCHERLRVDLSSKLNFIVGSNGSGKSAILTAIAVGLGGKAAQTNRGHSLKELVQQGQNYATVIIRIRNKGVDAFRASEYGPLIAVERRLTKEGGSSYKLWHDAPPRKVVSTKREDLMALCDHFHIQVDNPLTILTQDTARAFLMSSSPADKYRFFLRGTQLESYLAELESATEQLQIMKGNLVRKQKSLTSLEKQVKALQNRFDEMKQVLQLQETLENYEQQLIWCAVDSSQQHVHNLSRECQKAQNKVDAAEGKLEAVQKQLEAAQQETQEMDAERRKFIEAEQPLRDEQQQLEEQRRATKQLLKELDEEMNKTRQEKIRFENEAALLGQQIQEQVKRLQQRTNEQELPVIQEMEHIQASLQAREQERNQLETQQQQGLARIQQLRPMKQEADRRLGAVLHQHKQMASHLDNLKRSDSDRLHLFGQQMPQLVKLIQQEQHRFRHLPVGPVGVYLEVRDPSWALAIESVVGQHLDTFIVSCHEDQRLLQSLLQRLSMHCKIAVQSLDQPHPQPKQEPSTEFLTAFRMLVMQHPSVSELLHVWTPAARTVLMDDRVHANRLAQQRPSHVEAIFTKEGLRISVQSNSRSQSFQASRSHQRPRLFGSVQDQIQEMERNMMGMQQEIEIIQRDVQLMNHELQQLTAQQGELGNAIESRDRGMAGLRARLRDLQSQLQSVEHSMDTSLLDQERSEALERSLRVQQQLDALQQQAQQQQAHLLHLESLLHPLAPQLEALKQQQKQILDRCQACIQKATRMNALHRQEREKKDAAMKDLSSLMEQLKEAENKLKARIVAANEICAPVEVQFTKLELKNKIESIKKRIEQEEQELGNVVQVEAELKAKQVDYERSRDLIEKHLLLHQRMTESVAARKARWLSMLSYASVRAKLSFADFMFERGYHGVLNFRHDARELTLEVQTAAASVEQQQRRDNKSLSGGEKSFSTICFLLSLWDSVMTPLRCLDEFDVFMDAVNRTLSMKMIIDYCKKNAHQFILITPQDMSGVDRQDAKVHQMRDPER